MDVRLRFLARKIGLLVLANGGQGISDVVWDFR